MGRFLGLSMWDLNVITNVHLRGNRGRFDGRDRGDVMTEVR